MAGKRTKTWLYLGLGAVGLALIGRSLAAVATGDTGGGGGNGSGGGPSGTPCNYPPPGQPLPGKTKTGLTQKIIPIIFAEDSRPVNYLMQQEASALAGALDMGLPVDIVTALAWRESRFKINFFDLQQKIADNQAIGPLQVKPQTFADVGMNASDLLHLDIQNQIQYAVSAGEEYLLKLHSHYLPNYSWCDVLQAYNLGPSAFLNGKRNSAYANDIIQKALTYSELRTT